MKSGVSHIKTVKLAKVVKLDVFPLDSGAAEAFFTVGVSTYCAPSAPCLFSPLVFVLLFLF